MQTLKIVTCLSERFIEELKKQFSKSYSDSGFIKLWVTNIKYDF